MSGVPVMTEAPEFMFAHSGVHMDNGKVSKVEIPVEQFSSNPVKCFGPLWVRYDIYEAAVAKSRSNR